MSNFDPILIDLPESLVGQKVLVRRWRTGDGPALHAAVKESLEHISPWLPWGPLHESEEITEAFVRKWAARWDTREDLPASIWERVSGQFVGGCGLHRIDWKVRSFEIGYWARASAVGHGYITEATALLTAMAFDALAANRVFIRVAVGNSKSMAIPRRLGFVEEGTHRNAITDANGRLCDLLVFALTPEDWKSHASDT